MDYRTDLAMEAYTLWKKDAGETTKLPGVIAREEDAGGSTSRGSKFWMTGGLARSESLWGGT